MFLLSNNLHDSEDGDQGLELLCSLFDRDASLTTKLTGSRVPSARAAWESLFEFSMDKKRRDTFRVLVDIGFHNHWLSPWHVEKCLLFAVEMDDFDTPTRIVAHICGSHYRWYEPYNSRVILAAYRKGNVECASLLIQHCNVNATVSNWVGFKDSMFLAFVHSFNNGNHGDALALKLFLANGANVDKYTRGSVMTVSWRPLVGRNEISKAMRPTVLDEAYYSNCPLFDELSLYSTVPVLRITRTGLLVALEDSAQALRDYFLA